MRVVGGKPDSNGRREAVIVWTVPGGAADIAGLQQGDKVFIIKIFQLVTVNRESGFDFGEGLRNGYHIQCRQQARKLPTPGTGR